MRRLAAAVGLAGVVVLLPAPAVAHGIGGRSDLPVPLEYFLVGAAIVLLISFGALSLTWPTPRLQDGPRFRGKGWRIPRWLAGTVGTTAVVVLVAVIGGGIFGGGGTRDNLAPVTVWVVFWLVLPFAAAVVGNLWSAVNPWAVLGRLARFDGQGTVTTVTPAVVALLVFVWLELVYPRSGDPRTLGLAALGYTVYLLVWSWRVGTNRAMGEADAFTVYHRLISGIAPFGRDGERVRWRGWMRALPALPEWRGLALFAVAAIGTVTYDGLSATLVWDDLTFALVGTGQNSLWFQTVALLAVVAIVASAYWLASWVAVRLARSDLSVKAVARSFAHTLVPIALAYAVAHYLTLILFEGQLLVPVLSDPFGQGWNLFGTADYRINYTWLSPTAVWWLQLATVLGGHVAGVTLSHDRALAVFQGRRAVKSQYAMLALMIGLTSLALTLLAVA